MVARAVYVGHELSRSHTAWTLVMFRALQSLALSLWILEFVLLSVEVVRCRFICAVGPALSLCRGVNPKRHESFSRNKRHRVWGTVSPSRIKQQSSCWGQEAKPPETVRYHTGGPIKRGHWPTRFAHNSAFIFKTPEPISATLCRFILSTSYWFHIYQIHHTKWRP